jgi:predicted transcriptional regulator
MNQNRIYKRPTLDDKDIILLLLLNKPNPPTIREMQKELLAKSQNTIWNRVNELIKMGLVENINPGKSRGYRLTQKGKDLLSDLRDQGQIKY